MEQKTIDSNYHITTYIDYALYARTAVVHLAQSIGRTNLWVEGISLSRGVKAMLVENDLTGVARQSDSQCSQLILYSHHVILDIC